MADLVPATQDSCAAQTTTPRHRNFKQAKLPKFTPACPKRALLSPPAAYRASLSYNHGPILTQAVS